MTTRQKKGKKYWTGSYIWTKEPNPASLVSAKVNSTCISIPCTWESPTFNALDAITSAAGGTAQGVPMARAGHCVVAGGWT